MQKVAPVEIVNNIASVPTRETLQASWSVIAHKGNTNIKNLGDYARNGVITMTKQTITLVNETTIAAKGTRNNKKCKPTAKIDRFGNLTTYTSSIDAAEKNGLYSSDMSKYIANRKTHKGNMYCFVSELPEFYDYIMQKQNEASKASTEQQEKIAELEAKAKIYDDYIKAKQQREADIAETAELLLHAQQNRIDLEARVVEAREREITLAQHLQQLQANEVTLA